MKLTTRILLLLTVFVLAPLSAATRQHSGIIILAVGEVRAIASDHSERPLKRRSKFYSGDIIAVGKGAKAQIRFTDGTLLSLQQNTRIRIDDFSFSGNPSDSSNRNFITLLQGGFRTITGAVGKVNPDAHAVKTPVATIGVRGTVYSVNYHDALDVGVYSGKVRISNDSGRIEIGAADHYDFATVPALDARPRGLTAQPDTLVVGREADSAMNLAAAGGKRSASGSTAATAQDFSAEAAAPGADSARVIAAASSPAPDGVLLSNGDAVYASTTRFIHDMRLSDTEFNAMTFHTLGVVAGASRPASLPDPLLFMRATDSLDTTIAPLMADTVGYPDTGAPRFVLRENTGTVAGSQDSTVVNTQYDRLDTTGVVAVDLRWGAWNSSFDSYTDPGDSTVVEPIAGNLYWVAGTPSDPATVSTLSGTVTYADLGNLQGMTSRGAIDAISSTASLNVDFTNSAVNGTLGFTTGTGTDSWALSMAGNLTGAQLDLNTISGTVNGNAGLNGSGAAILVGDRAEVVGGVFNVTNGAASDWAQGSFAIGCAPNCI